MATISHHDGSVESLGRMVKTSVKELIIFHKDGEDYAEI
jgi:hypothetical protein